MPLHVAGNALLPHENVSLWIKVPHKNVVSDIKLPHKNVVTFGNPLISKHIPEHTRSLEG